MDVITIERDLTAYIADKLGMTVDTDIFRGGIPDRMDAAAVFLNGELKSYAILPRTYNAQVIARFNDRDEAFRFLSRLSGLFPVQGVTQGESRFMYISQRGDSEPYRDGLKWSASFNMIVAVLTTGAQI